jgi:site-specific recombinase XerD
MLLESGVAMRVVQEVLGHSSRAVTADVYSHVTPAFKRQAARRAGRISGAGSE